VNGWRKSSHSFSNGNCAEVAAWRTSSHSGYNGNCTEVTAWRKSTASIGNGDCAEVGQDGAVVGVRDSQDPDGPVLVFGPVAWVAFLEGLRSA